MISLTSMPRLLVPVRPPLLQTSSAKSLLDQDGGESGIPESAPIAAGSALGADRTANSGKWDDKGPAQKAVTNGQKTIVDQRTTDAGSLKITVIAYSDGSSDTLREIKEQGLSSLTGAQPNKVTSMSDKGLVVDKLG